MLGGTVYDRHLDVFLSVVELGSFAKAASACHISRAALMQQINLLEKDLGFALFTRSNRGAELTPAGALVANRAKQIIQISRDTVNECRLLESGKTIRIGILPNLPLTILGPICLEYQSTYPDISIEFVERSASEYLSAFLNNEFDVTADYMSRLSSDRADIRFAHLATDRFDCAVPANSPLAFQRSIAPKDLFGKRVALLMPGLAQAEDGLRRSIEVNYPEIHLVDVRSYSKSIPLMCALHGSMLFHYHVNAGEYEPLVSKPFDIEGIEISLGLCYRANARRETLSFVHFAETYCENNKLNL